MSVKKKLTDHIWIEDIEMDNDSPDLGILVSMLGINSLPRKINTGVDRKYFKAMLNDGSLMHAGFIGLEFYKSGVLLRSLVVNKGHQSRGVGEELVGESLKYAREHSNRVYLITKIPEYFERFRKLKEKKFLKL